MRKIYLLTIAMACISFVSNAQLTKGATFLGGSLNVSSNKSESTLNQETKTTEWGIRPQIGKAIADNKILGVFLNFGRSKSTQTSPPTNSSQNESSAYGGGIFLRNYYSIGKRFFLFGDAGLGINLGKSESTNSNGTTNFTSGKNKNTGVNLSLTPGISFAATRKVHLEAAFNNLLFLSYQSSETTNYNSNGTVFRTTDGKSFNANANANAFSNIAVGLRWILPSK